MRRTDIIHEKLSVIYESNLLLKNKGPLIFCLERG